MIDIEIRRLEIRLADIEFFVEWCHIEKDRVYSMKIADHPLVGKRCVHTGSGNVYRVQEVWLQYCTNGWYWTASIERNKSHGMCYFDNYNCADDVMVGCINRDKGRYSFVLS